jgi:hypothetical protein
MSLFEKSTAPLVSRSVYCRAQRVEGRTVIKLGNGWPATETHSAAAHVPDQL